MRDPVQVWLSRLAALLAVFSMPPAFVAACGGADLDLPFVRVIWYDAPGSGLTFATAIFAALLEPRAAPLVRVFYALGLGSLSIAVWAAVGGGFETDWLSARHALRPAALAALAFALAGVRARGVGQVHWIRVAFALLLGVAASGYAIEADRSHLRERIRAADTASAARSDVLFIVIDTLRADALGFASGEADSPTPVLDALAAEAVVFDEAFAQAPWTLPSMMSLVTGHYVSTLYPGWRGAWPEAVRLEEEPPLLAAALRDAGYHTAGFVKNPMLARGSGFERGYDIYEWVGGEDADGEAARQLVDATLRWAREFADRRADGPGDESPAFFLSVHFMDPHAHYRPPREFWSEEARRYAGNFDGHTSTLKELTRGPNPPAAADVEQMRRLYRDEVRYVDAQIGRLFEELTRLGLLDAETLIVLTADHGEQFGEHGTFEHRAIYVENVHVPLVIRVPGQQARRLGQPVGLIDVAPTLLDLLGLSPLTGSEGISRVASLRGQPQLEAPVLTEFGDAIRVTDGQSAVLRGENGEFEFYDRERDAAEQTDLAPSELAGFQSLVRALRLHEAAIPEVDGTSTPRLGVRERARLRALGYSD